MSAGFSLDRALLQGLIPLVVDTTHPKIYLVDAGLFRTLRPTGPFDRPEELAGAALEGVSD